MRIGGLASGINTEELVDKLMAAERMPLDRMEQDRTTLEWKRDSFRDINRTLLELDQMMLDMKLSKTYNSKMVASSMENAVTATAKTSASNGSFRIEVSQLASSAMNISQLNGDEKIDIDQKVSEFDFATDEDGNITFKTYDEEGEADIHQIEIDENDTVKDILDKINDQDNHVRAFYDDQSGRVVLETTRTGQYNPDEAGREIDFGEGSFFTNVLKMTGKETGGKNAEFTYNDGLTITSRDNSYTLNDVTFNFNNTTNGESAMINVSNDTEGSFEAIMAFVDKYNEVVDIMNGSQKEEKHRDFQPLTEEQKNEMSEKEIELWEEKAKSGILRGESVISNGLFSMRNSWYSKVETGGELTTLTQIGIKTSSNYMDGGKLIVDEDALKEALNNDPDGVQKLFSNSAEDESRGLVNRLEDALETTMDSIKKRAGNSTSASLDNYTLGKRMKDLNNQISAFEDRLVQIETRYWNQFSAMEQAIQRMNQQSEYLMSQFGQM